MSEGADDVQSVFGFCVNVVSMLVERHPSIECDSKDFGAVCDWYGCVVKCYLWLCFVFCVVRCNECEGGFVCGDVHSVVDEPLF